MEISLRPPRIEDIDCYFEIFSDDETHHFIIDEGKQDLDGSKLKLSKLIEINGSKKRIYSICNDLNVVGFIVIHFDNSNFPYISYAIRRSSQGKGFASKALIELLKIEKNNFRGFKAATHLENKASQNLLIKCNFTSNGIKELEMGRRVLFEYRFSLIENF